jgi:hypothetical protein
MELLVRKQIRLDVLGQDQIVVTRLDHEPHVLDCNGIDRAAAMVYMSPHEVYSARRAYHKDFAVRAVPVGECFKGTQTHPRCLGSQIAIAAADFVQSLAKFTAFVVDQINPTTDRPAAIALNSHTLLSLKMHL